MEDWGFNTHSVVGYSVMALIFQVALVANCSFSVIKINFDDLIYEP